jgi:SAM-dependent methyltransferase
MTLAPPRLWLDGGRVRHAIGAETISNDLADWIAEDLVAPGLIGPSEFEAVFVEAVLAVDPDPAVAWTAFYRNTLAALDRGGAAAGTNAGMAPVHARAVELAVGPHVVELGCCFGFLSLRLARAGFRVTAVDLVPGTARLLGSVAPRLLTEAATCPDEMRNSRRRDAQLAEVGSVTAVAGDACAVPLAGDAADTVLAVHLLEHLPPALAPVVLTEMLRVARRRAVVAVPFEDEPNPTWGHVRTFDLAALDALGAATGRPYAAAEYHGGWLVVDV